MRKKLVYFFFLLSFIIPVSQFLAYADGEGEGIEIPIIRPGGIGGSGNTGPHMPEIIPIQAIYDTSCSMLVITFLQNIGTVCVSITNETTSQTSVFNTLAVTGPQYFPIAGTPGFYTITITLSNGEQYYGELTL